MKALHLLALGSVLSASLVIAQTQTAPAINTPPQTTIKTTKSKKKAKADAASPTPAPAAKAAVSPSAPAAKPAAPAIPAATSAVAPPAAPSAKPSATPKAAAPKPPPPSPGDIADAKAKGLVWLNLNTKVYHGSGDKEYGTTKNGKFMTEADAKAAGARIAKK